MKSSNDSETTTSNGSHHADGKFQGPTGTFASGSDSGPAEKKAVNGSIHTYSWSLSADSDVHREIHQ